MNGIIDVFYCPENDMMEIYGTNGEEDMPGYVLAPGDNVFVAAYPIIEIEVDADNEKEAEQIIYSIFSELEIDTNNIISGKGYPDLLLEKGGE